MIKDLVSKLPEIYQAIYNHLEYKTSRNCDHRLNYITDIVKAYQAKTGKTNLKVLDIGCAQGYYSLQLAAMGCKVTGVDFNQANINLCKGLAEESKLSVKFSGSFGGDMKIVMFIVGALMALSGLHIEKGDSFGVLVGVLLVMFYYALAAGLMIFPIVYKGL